VAHQVASRAMGYGPAIITPSPLLTAEVGFEYATALNGIDGYQPYSFAVVSGSLPGGLSLSSAGVISGMPTAASPFVFGVQITDTKGAKSNVATFSLTVVSMLAITTTSLPSGTVGTPYSATLAASGGVTPYAWALVGGSLDPGLSLNTSSGAITGTPVSANTYSPVFQVTDALGYSVQQGLSLLISLPVAATPTFSPGAGTYSSVQTVTITSSTAGNTIYYTTNGTTPTTGSTVYSGPITVAVSETVNAIAIAGGYSQSGVGSAAYVINATQAATPTFNPAAGTYTSTQTVTISCATPSSTLYYTTDGSTPTTSSTLYTAPITVSVTENVKAIATASGYTQSAVGSAAYTINAASYNAAQIKFNPGHYMAQAGNSLSSDISDLTSYGTGIVGYVLQLSWAQVDTGTSGPVYNFSTIDSAYTSVKALGKHLIVSFKNSTYVGNVCNPIGGADPYNTSNAASGQIPSWLIHNGPNLSITDSLTGTVYSTTAFPASPNPSQYGWFVWGFNGNSGLTAGFEFIMGAHQYHPVAAAAYTNMYRALLNHVMPSGLTFNNDPYCEMIQDIDELTFSMGFGSSYLPAIVTDTTYKINGVLAAYNDINGNAVTAGQVSYTNAQLYRFIADSKTRAIASAPNTSIGCCDGFGLYGTDGQNNSTTHTNFMQAVNAGRVVLMGSDTFSNSFGLYPNTTNAYSAATAWSQSSHPQGYASYWLKLYVGCAWNPMSGNPYSGTTFSSPPSYGVPATNGTCFFNAYPGLVANNVENLDYNQNPSTGVSAYTQAMVNSIYNSAQYYQPPWSFWANTDNQFQSPDAWTTYIYAAIQGFGTYPFQLLPPAYMSAPQNLHASVVGTTTLTLNWNPQTVGTGTGLTYTISQNGTDIPGATGLSISTSSYNVTGLTANNAYAYTIRISNSNGASAESAAYNVTTNIFQLANFAGSPPITYVRDAAGYHAADESAWLTGFAGDHEAGGIWWNTQVNIQAFVCAFTFKPLGSGLKATITGGSAVVTLTGTNYFVSGGGETVIVSGPGYTAPVQYFTVGVSGSTIGLSLTSGGAAVVFPTSATVTLIIISGMTFCIQNSTLATNPNYGGLSYNGLDATSDANCEGYGSLANETTTIPGIGNSVGLKFSINPQNLGMVDYPPGGAPNKTGLYINGGVEGSLTPDNDMNPYGIDMTLGNLLACVVTYDSAILQMVLRDTVTGAQCRQTWPINVPACVGQNTAWVGFTCGQRPPFPAAIFSWSYATSSGTRLSTPILSSAPGSYGSAQTVTMTGPAGASIYYTTSGLLPTSASTLYTTPITVSANAVVQVIAIQPGFTDSLVGGGAYLISTSNVINFANFSSVSPLLLCGYAQHSGSQIILTDKTTSGSGGGYLGAETSAAWFPVPVNIQSGFSGSFTFEIPNSISTAGENDIGFCFVMQNFVPSSTNTDGAFGTANNWISGGPTIKSNFANSLGYSGNAYAGETSFGQTAGIQESVALAFDLILGSAGGVGLYTSGAQPTGSSTNISGGLSLYSGNPITCAYSYSGTTFSITLTDFTAGKTFSHSWTVNIPSEVGGNTAYVGFTANTQYSNAIQYLNAWTMVPG
jgi:hypothetical protein